MSDKKTIIKNFQSMKPSIVFKQLDYSKLPKEVRDKMKGDLSGVSDDTLDLQFEQSTFKKWIETFADLYPAAFGIKEDAKVVSIAPVAKVEPVVKSEPIVLAEEKPVDTSELETKIKDLETRLSVVNKMILKQPLKKTELKIRVKTIEKMIAKFKEELKKTKTASKKKVVKKSLGGFLFGALGGFIAGQLIDLKLTRKKVRFDLGGTLEGDKKYQYSVTYQTITPESAEEGDFDSQGFEVEKTIDELQDILQEAVNRYGIHEPSSTKNENGISSVMAGCWWSSVSPDNDRDYFEKGIEKYYSLHIYNVDGSELTQEESQFITNKLKEGRKLHWDEEDKDWYKDGGQIHSKDTDGTLVFKADTKGGKYSIEVRQDSNIHGVHYSVNDYTNGSLRGVGTQSNKELLMHKLIDTILGSKKIDGINYIISHDDLGVKEYLPASEKIWDIYNSAEFREWFKKQNETLTEEQKQSLSDELKNKAIKYVRDNGYKQDDSTIGTFFQLFRKNKLVTDFYSRNDIKGLKVGDVVYNKVHNTIGIVRDVFDKGEVRTDADGVVSISDLEFYDKSKHSSAEIAPSTKKELGDKFENGGDVQTQEWLSNMNQERINELKEQRAKIEKEMPEDYKETSGGSGRTKAEILADFDRHISERENLKFKNGGGVYSIPYDTETTGVFKLVADGVNTTIRLAGAEKNDSDTYSFYQFDTDRNDDIGSIIVNNRAIDKLSKGVTVIGTGSKNGIKYKITRVSNVFENGGGVGNVESQINDLYSKSNFINDDFNWKMKLLEMLQDRSIEAYNIYQSLSENQKEEVLQELFETDNDMGSDGDGELSTSKENLEILLEDAKNGNKYSDGGDFEKALENLHSKASSSTTPRGKNKINIPVTDEKQRLVNFILNDILSKNPDVDENKYKTLINFNLGKVKKHTWGAGYFLQNLGETVLKDAKSSVNTSNFFNAETEIAVSKYETGRPDEDYEQSRELARLKKQPLGDKFGNGGSIGDFYVTDEKEEFYLGTILDMGEKLTWVDDFNRANIYNSLVEAQKDADKKQQGAKVKKLNNILKEGGRLAVGESINGKYFYPYYDDKSGKKVYLLANNYREALDIGTEISLNNQFINYKNEEYITDVNSFSAPEFISDKASIGLEKKDGKIIYKGSSYIRDKESKGWKKEYSKGGGVNLDKDKFSLTSINNDLVEMVIGEDWTAKEFKEHFLNKGYELKPDNSIVGFYFAKPDGQTFQLVPSFHKKGEIIKYRDGGSVSSDNTPKVYIADLAAYNEGKLVGEWLDLSEFGSGEEVMQKISELLKEWSKEAGEEREEYSVHDMENFPKQMYSEGMGESSFQKVIDYWEAINGTDYPMEVVEEFASLTGEDAVDAANKMKDAYYGKFDSVDDFAREYVDSVGGIEGVSNPEQYIDISETDKRIIASEEADNVVDGMSDDDILKQANLDNEYQEAEESENEEEMERILEEAKESVREEIESEWEKGLRNPYNFLVEEQGLYDASSIMKANFIMFDYKKFGKDLEYDYYTIEHDGEVYVFSQNYKKGGSLPSSRTLGVSKGKVVIETNEFRPEKLKEQTKTNKKPKTMAKKISRFK